MKAMLAAAQLEVPLVRQMYARAEQLGRGEKLAGLVEPDSIPSSEYRQRIVRILTRHGLIESTGGPYFFDMIRFAPDPRAAEALAHVATEELGHGRMLLECLEPFGVDHRALFHQHIGRSASERMAEVALAPPEANSAASWTDVLAITMLIDPAGILVVGARVLSNYGPLARASALTLIEEREHAAFWERWGRDVLADPGGRAELQRSIDRIFPIALGTLGRPESDSPDFALERRLGLWSIDPAELQRTLRAMLEITLPPLGLRLPAGAPNYANAFW
jgi:ring-1,2-phenylacetyl-CoA epoxidase subunit PaaA